MTFYGNNYERVQLPNGQYAFQQVENKEILHGLHGASHEADALYMRCAEGILGERDSPVIWDVGLGCGAQLLALFRRWEKGELPRQLKVVSFDLEKRGLESFLENSCYFTESHTEVDLIQRCRDSDVVRINKESRTFSWQFIQGDFRQTVGTAPQVDIVFYDFFSPAKNPQLWNYFLINQVVNKMKSRAMLVTYSSSTAVRAVLLGTDLFVAEAPVAGSRWRGTCAVRQKKSFPRHVEPLPHQWLNRFRRSQKPFLEGESPENRRLVENRLEKHPQLAK